MRTVQIRALFYFLQINFYRPVTRHEADFIRGKIYIDPNIAYLGLQHVRAEVHQE